MEIPVYLILGFLEGGKTHFIRETLQDPNFTEQEHTLIIVCEEGEEEYDPAFCKRTNSVVQVVEDLSELTGENLRKWDDQYKPDRVIIEYNGMWQLSELNDVVLPRNWVCYQVIDVCDSTTFTLYQNNMRSLMSDKFQMAEMVLFNRCTPEIDKNQMARSVRVVNRRCQLGFERPDGTEDTTFVETSPFDLDADIIEIGNDDYGLWYTEIMDEPKKYRNKTVRFLAQVCIDPKFPKNSFALGRHAMVCCADDIAYLAMICKAERQPVPKHESWVMLTAEVRVELNPLYGDRGPVLYAKSIEPAEEPKNRLLYF